MHQSKHSQTTLRIKGVGIVDVVTVAGLARVIGKSRNTVLRYENTDLFPIAPIMVGTKRYYPLSLARKLIPLVEKIANGRKPDAELIVMIHKLFKEEKGKLCQKEE